MVTESGNNGFRHWKRTVTAQYALEITIQCQDSENSAQFLSHIENKSPDRFKDTPPNEGQLKAVWEDLPKCPSEGQLLTLKRAHGHKSLEQVYKLEVGMGWTRKRESLLERSNKLFTRQKNPTRQLLTPSASEDLHKASKRYNVTWTFRQDGLSTRSMTSDRLTCPLCPDEREHVSFDRLQLHCLTHHDYLSFESQDLGGRPETGIIHKAVTIGLAKEYPEKPVRCGEDEIHTNWTAPDRPFDLVAYLRGVDDWPGYHAQRTKTSKPRGRAAHKDRESASASQVAPLSMRKRPAPDDVEDLPEHRPKRHRVPNVPGVSFYRTTSKQLLKPGDIITESDDDVDESWLAQNQVLALQDLGFTGAAKDFTRAFNQHLAREQSDSSVLLRDGLVRFTRAYSSELKGIEWQRLFRAKLNQFRNAKIIDDDLVAHCVRGMQTASEPKTNGVDREGSVGNRSGKDTPNGSSKHSPEVQPLEPRVNDRTTKQHDVDGDIDRLDTRERKKWTSGKLESRPPQKDANASPNGIGTPKTTNGVSNVRSKTRTCVCGKSAKDARGGIACADPVSIALSFSTLNGAEELTFL